jgi:hypothetical protein
VFQPFVMRVNSALRTDLSPPPSLHLALFPSYNSQQVRVGIRCFVSGSNLEAASGKKVGVSQLSVRKRWKVERRVTQTPEWSEKQLSVCIGVCVNLTASGLFCLLLNVKAG